MPAADWLAGIHGHQRDIARYLASEVLGQQSAEMARFLLRTSRNCHVPEIVFTRPSEGLDTP